MLIICTCPSVMLSLYYSNNMSRHYKDKARGYKDEGGEQNYKIIIKCLGRGLHKEDKWYENEGNMESISTQGLRHNNDDGQGETHDRRRRDGVSFEWAGREQEHKQHCKNEIR